MAVPLSCPACGARLRLPQLPEPGTEIECPQCGHAFDSPDVGPSGRPAEERTGRGDDDTPRKRRPADDDDDDRPKKSAEKEKKKADKLAQPKRKRAKVKKANPYFLAGVIGGGLLFLVFAITVLVWYLGRKSAAFEMMTYLPEDCEVAVGINYGHIQKYPEFSKNIDTSFGGTGHRRAAGLVAKAAGKETNDLLDYAVQGMVSTTRPAGATVIRTKTEFDPAVLAKVSGAKEYSADGQKYYTIPDIAELGYRGLRMFAPTNRLVVFCPGDLPDATFKKMLKGNPDNREKAIVGRMGDLGKRASRGTFWVFGVFGTSLAKPAAPPAQPAAGGAGGGLSGGNDAAIEMAKVVAEAAASAKGFGFKASVGSRAIRFEIMVWCKDGETATGMSKKWGESELSKGDEGNPPKWWKDQTQSLGDQKIGRELLANLGFGASGEVFYARSEVDTKLLLSSAGTFLTKFGGQQGGGGGGGPPGGLPGGGVPLPGGGGPGGPGGN